MSHRAHLSHGRGRFVRLISALAVTVLSVLGLVAVAAPAQAEVRTDHVAPLNVQCYFGAFRVIAEGEFTLDQGDTVTSFMRVDGHAEEAGTYTATTHSGLSLSGVSKFIDNDDAPHFFEWVVNDVVLSSGTFSYLTSCNPQPVPASATFGTPVCTESGATASVDITTHEGESVNFTVTATSAEGTKTRTGRPEQFSGVAHFDVPLATTGATKVSAVQNYRPTLTAAVDEHTYNLPDDCNAPTPTPTPTPTETVAPTPEPTDSATATPSPSPTEGTVSASASLSTSMVTPGGQLTVTGRGYASGESIELWLHSTPVKLATLTASADGTFSRTVTIPEGTEAGTHHIEVRTAGGAITSLNLTVVSGLAVTGVSNGAATMGVLLAVPLLGLGLWLMILRRRSSRA